ncbi:MAG: hypothetical protein M3R72_10755 [Bacteroidota bacterium]|nr:hypothetical protein [Bacteroidota bacterium]
MQRFIFFDCQVENNIMTRLILISFLIITLVSCKKSQPEGVMISIENNLGFTLDSVKLANDASNYNYGTILPGKNTAYIFFKSMPNVPAATADSANKKLFAGHYIPPNSYPLPMLANGKYTLQIFPDSTLFYLYGAKFIKN